jgi:hypothetical protein
LARSAAAQGALAVVMGSLLWTEAAAECVVADAVDLEPVSRPKSLLTGKRTGNFLILARFNER